MDISNARSEARWRFKSFFEQHNIAIKLTTVAVERLDSDLSNHGREAFTDWLRDSEEPWGSNPLQKDDGVAVQLCRAHLAEAGVVRAFSAYEEYVSRLISDSDHLTIDARQDSTVDDDDDKLPKTHPQTVCSRLGLDGCELDRYCPAFDLFRLVRNCIVHRNGIVSNALSCLRHSDSLEDCLRQWPCRRPDRILGDLPPMHEGDSLSLLPRHAILAAAVFQEAIGYLDKAWIFLVGETGVLRMAVRYGFMQDVASRLSPRQTAEVAVNILLTERYRVQGVSSKDSILQLKKVGLWEKCRNSHARLAGGVA